MKKIISIILVCFTGLFFISCENSLFEKEEVKAERILRENLLKRYNEEFVILGMGKRGMNSSQWYECTIIPKSIVGTNRENDEYYWASGFVELEDGKYVPGDTYGGVLLNESANKFFGKKLKELFGDNFISVINMEGPYDFIDFEEEMESRKPLYEQNPNGKFYPIAGGIYIFGRVENEEDREWYRKQIYEFVQFMKETGTFEYVGLWIAVLDERVLSDEFKNNKGDQDKLISLFDKYSNSFLKERKIIMDKYSENYLKTSKGNKSNIIESYGKGGVYGENSIGIEKLTCYNMLLLMPLYSSKYVEVQQLDHREKLDYSNEKDVKFLEEYYIKGE
jgi:hypothetical protein